MARQKSPTTGARLRRTRNRRLALRRDAIATPLRGVESLERRQVMAGDMLTADPGPVVTVDNPFDEGRDTSTFVAAAAPAAPTNVIIGWSGDHNSSDALSFQFGEQPQPGDTWRVLENGVPIAVNTQYYKGLTGPTWETTIDALPFDFTGKQSWELARNPVILPTADGLRALTAGNRYEIEVIRGGASATGSSLFGRFRGASADGVNETQTGTVALLDLDFGAAAPAGVTLVRAMQGEQVAALVLDAGTKVTLRLGELGFRSLYTSTLPLLNAALVAQTNRPDVVTATVAKVADSQEWTLTLDTSVLQGKAGLVSVRIVNTAPGTNVVAPRYLGIVVKDSGGSVPARPEWLAVGAVNTNDADAQNFFRGTDPTDPTGFKAFDTQYIYLNDGPLMRPAGQNPTPTSPLEPNPKAWRISSDGFDGKKLVQSLRESAKFGAVPQIVYYNVMTPNESQAIALANLQNRPFMVEYFKDLKFTIDTIREFAAGTTVALILEPDLLAYMMQSARKTTINPDGSTTVTYNDPSTIPAMTDAAYEAGLLPDPGAGNRLPNTLPGFVEAINRGVRHLSSQTVEGVTRTVNLEYGWKFNLWAYDTDEPGSVAKITDVLGWAAGRAKVQEAARATADWYTKAGILSGDDGRTMDFIALDKYGTDGGATGEGYVQNGPGYVDPANATYLWNADHWNNYLLFAKTLHDTLGNRPVRLWQLPVGHVNGSNFMVNGQPVADLANIDKQWEDSAVNYFFGDTFTGASRGRKDNVAAAGYFASNQADDPLVSRVGTGPITWGSHMAAARDAGIESIMFGPGLANSTQGGGYIGPPLDGSFWAEKAQDYLENPLPISRAPTSSLATTLTAQPQAVVRSLGAPAPAAVVTVHRTGDLSRRLSLPVRAIGGSADAGSDYHRTRLHRRRVTFAPGQSSAILEIPTLPARKPQPHETLRLRIGGATRSQPVVRTMVEFGTTAGMPTSTPPAAVFVARLSNQIRAIETFSDPTNPGQIIAQLREGEYPNPEALNRVGEISGTNGLAAYPGDGRNTPGAFQVDLANMGIRDPYNPWQETFGEWKGTAQSDKNASPFDTQIALSKGTLSEFFGIEVDDGGLITRIPAAAAAVFLRNDALASATTDVWDPTANPLVGQHIDAFQTEQLALYLAGRSPVDGSTGVKDDRTAPKPVMDLALGLQSQVSRSFMYGVYQKFQHHDAYKEMFAEVKPYLGSTLEITATTASFGVSAGEEFWCRLNGAFIVAGTYVRGEGNMYNLLTAFVQAAKTGSGTWVIEPNNPAANVTITRVTPAGTIGADAVFSVDKTPINVNPSYPSIFHYGAVVSPMDDGVDWNDKAAWGIKDRSTAGGLGYTRLAASEAVTGTTTVSQPGRYVYSGLAAGGTLTLTGPGPFVIIGAAAAAAPTTITDAGYPQTQNNSQTVGTRQKIDISSFGMTTPEQVFNASFYGWFDNGALRMAQVNDPAVPSGKSLYLYFVPAAGGDPANVLANQGAFYDSASPYYRAARVAAASVDILGRPATAAAWANNFLLTPPTPGSGIIDASGATGNVLVIADDTVATVKLGSGRSIAFGIDSGTQAKTYVLNPQPAVGSGARPLIGMNAGDTIEARLVTGQPAWTIDGRDLTTFDNGAATGTPYRRYSALSRPFATAGSATPVAEFTASLRTAAAVSDPAAVIRAALRT